MPAKSKKQQRLFGMVHQCQKTGDCASDDVKKIAGHIEYKDADDFASTKHKGLPEKVKKKKDESFKQWIERQPILEQLKESKMACTCNCESCKKGNCSGCTCENCKCDGCGCN